VFLKLSQYAAKKKFVILWILKRHKNNEGRILLPLEIRGSGQLKRREWLIDMDMRNKYSFDKELALGRPRVSLWFF